MIGDKMMKYTYVAPSDADCLGLLQTDPIGRDRRAPIVDWGGPHDCNASRSGFGARGERWIRSTDLSNRRDSSRKGVSTSGLHGPWRPPTGLSDCKARSNVDAGKVIEE